MVKRILLKRSVQHRVKTPPNVTFLHICDPVIWFKNQGSYTGFAKEGKISILWLSYGGSDHLLVIEDDIIEKHLVLLTTPLSPSLAMFMINLPSTIWSVDCSKDWPHSMILSGSHSHHLGEPSLCSMLLVFIDPYIIQSHFTLPSPCPLFCQRLKNCCCL